MEAARLLPKRLILLAWASLLLVAALTASHVVQAQSPDPSYDEAEALSIDRMIMCPVCPAETIDQAQVLIARQMRQMVRDMLSQGASREEILDFFADRYGLDILASPPKTGFNLLAWTFPIAGVAGALVAGLLIVRSMAARRVGPAAGGPQITDEELAPYLEMVDREITGLQGPGSSSPAPTSRHTGNNSSTPVETPPAETPKGTGAADRESGSTPKNV